MARANQLTWVPADAPPDAFPPVEAALRVPDGLLAAGGDLSPARLLAAYARGIFPWYEDGQPILWWSPDPRAVLFPDEIRITRSLRKKLRNGGFEVSFDRDFAAVVAACAAPRDEQTGTWITGDMFNAYVRLHRLGHAHSVETWLDGELVGGLYGVAIGKVFFGESMFSRATDASKVALVRLVERVQALGFELVDCQLASQHLASLGSRSLPRDEFVQLLREYCPIDDGSAPPSALHDAVQDPT